MCVNLNPNLVLPRDRDSFQYLLLGVANSPLFSAHLALKRG